MKRFNIIALFLIFRSLCITTTAATIGEWNAYMAYHDITDIEPAGNMVYVLGSDCLFSYNVKDQSVCEYTKTNSLSDCNIEYIAWNNAAKKLIIVYKNCNIDLLDNAGNVVNISSYYNYITTDKTINSVSINSNYAYLNTNFGIIKIDMRKSEIKETYNLSMKVYASAIKNGRIYAQTDNGIYSADVNENLINKANWSNDNSADAEVFKSDNDIERTSIYGYTECRIYDNANKCWWSNQKDGKLQSYTEMPDGEQTITRRDITVDGPIYNHFAFCKFYNNKLYTCGSSDWNMAYAAAIQVKNGNDWDIFQHEGISDITKVNFWDLICLDIDPIDPKHVVAGGRNGVYEFYDGKFLKFHNSETTNGVIQSAVINNNEYELITAVCFDRNGNLWCFNSQAFDQDKPLLKLDREGNWHKYGNSKLMTFDQNRPAGFIKSMITDSKGHLWFGNNDNRKTATYRYDIENDVLYTYDNFVNQDFTSIQYVQGVSSVAEDKEGNVWVGTSSGLLMLTPEQITTPSLGYTQVKVPRNDGTNYADYLLSGVNITAIAIDGANRKWIGTYDNGVYLISSDNMEELHHFKANNSKLLSDEIESISIDSNTGEVFIGTSEGLCSYMSDATEANEDMTTDNVWAYPNPVTPEYTGLITITGLSMSADVKICNAAGTLVAEGTSNGGTFTWNGRDFKGNKVASGVYMVQTAKADGSKGTVCKIAIIR